MPDEIAKWMARNIFHRVLVTSSLESLFCPRQVQKPGWGDSSNPEPGCEVSGRRGAESTFRVVDTQHGVPRHAVAPQEEQIPRISYRQLRRSYDVTVRLNQLHTGLLLRVRTFVRGVPIDHDVAPPPLRQLQPSPQATPYLLDATPAMATFDSPAPVTQPFWHTRCTWEEACKPLHAFDVFLYQCGLMPVHTYVSH